MTTPDLVFTGGRVFTASPTRPYAQAVAVTAGRISAVGPVTTLP